jgi:hypothetical protein
VIIPNPDPGRYIDETLLALLQNDIVDVGVVPIGITAQRFKKFSFIYSSLHRTYVAVIHQDHLISVKSSEFIIHLLGALVQAQVWICIGIVFCIMVFLGASLDIFGNRNEAFSARFVSNSIQNWIFRVFGTGLGVEGIGKALKGALKLMKRKTKFTDFV